MLSTIRSQSLLVVLVILMVTLASAIIISQSTYLLSVKEQVYENLESHNAYVDTLVSSDGSFDPGSVQEYADIQNIRITLIHRDGRVLFDSEYDESSLESHLYRQEVQSSLRTGTGTSERFSATQRLPVLYLSTYEGPQAFGFIRVSTPLQQLRNHRRVFTRYMALSSALLLLLTIAITAYALSKINRPLENVKQLAGSYANGNLKAKKIIRGPLELQQLSQVLMEMAEKLNTTVGELNTSRSMIETMINSVSQGLILLDSNLSVQIANSPSYALIGTDQVLDGKPIHRIIQSPVLMERLRQSLKEQTGLTLVLEHYNHLWGETAAIVGREQTKTIRIAIDPVYSETDNLAIVLTLTDMSAFAKLEQIRRDFVANVSHELKTPITAISGFAHTLLDEQESLSDEQKRYLSIIQRQSDNMLTVIQDLLLLSSLENGKAALTRSWVDIEHVVRQSINSCRYKADTKEIMIDTRIENPDSLSVYIHPMLIQQALTNLLMNAVNYSPDHSQVTVQVSVNEEDIIFKVTDHGVGIALEDQERIFERFYRVDAARSRSEGGTGLGLSIVKHIAQVHDGSVEVASSLGRGSTFTIRVSRKGKDFSSLYSHREEINS